MYRGNPLRSGLAILVLILGACTNAPYPEPSAGGQQIIIGFESAEHDVHAWMSEIDTELGLSLEYVRPMSGNLHVYRLPADTGRAIEDVIETLQVRPEVRQAEPDRRMHSQ